MNPVSFAITLLLVVIAIVVFCGIPLLFSLARRYDEQAKALYISNLINAWKYDQAMKTTAVPPPPPKPKNQGPKLYPLK